MRVKLLLLEVTTKTLALGNGAVFVLEKNGLQTYDLLAKSRYLRRKVVVLTAEDLYLGLEVRKPLLLTLATFKCGDPENVSFDEREIQGWCSLPVALQEIPPLLLICHLLTIFMVLFFLDVLLLFILGVHIHIHRHACIVLRLFSR